MNKPMIGIIPLIDIERESYWMLPGYMVLPLCCLLLQTKKLYGNL